MEHQYAARYTLIISIIDTFHPQVLVSRMYGDLNFSWQWTDCGLLALQYQVVSWAVTGVSDHNTLPILSVSTRMHTVNPELHNLGSYAMLSVTN